jgi:CBS domain-containing protein
MTDRYPLLPAATARDLMKEIPLVIPSGMGVGAAASLLDAVGTSVAPVVDPGGRCVGLFGAADYRRWLDSGGPRGEVVTDWQIVHPTTIPDEVSYHMTRRFAVATPEAGVHELLHRLNGVEDPYLVVLDRQRRPRGIVCALDVLAAEAGTSRRSASPSRTADDRCGDRSRGDRPTACPVGDLTGREARARVGYSRPRCSGQNRGHALSSR